MSQQVKRKEKTGTQTSQLLTSVCTVCLCSRAVSEQESRRVLASCHAALPATPTTLQLQGLTAIQPAWDLHRSQQKRSQFLCRQFCCAIVNTSVVIPGGKLKLQRVKTDSGWKPSYPSHPWIKYDDKQLHQHLLDILLIQTCWFYLCPLPLRKKYLSS